LRGEIEQGFIKGGGAVYTHWMVHNPGWAVVEWCLRKDKKMVRWNELDESGEHCTKIG
jgi:hypothetical protein